jgi:Putative auto-transporter adhesin, head GIN domain
MKTMPLLLALAPTLAVALAAPAAAAERRYSVTDFDRVQVDGPYEVTLTTGGSSQAMATGDQAAIDRVSIDVQGRTLRIRPNPSAWGGYPGARIGPVRVVVSTRDLRSAIVTGSGSLVIDRARGLRLDLSLSGSGSLSVASVDADTLTLGSIGSGEIRVAGKAKQLRLTVEGSGDFDGRGLVAEDAQIVAGTSGTLVVGAARTAKVTARGRGTVEILGTPACTLSGASAAMVICGK